MGYLGGFESGCDLLHDLIGIDGGERRMTATQADKAKQFRALHEAPEAFVIAKCVGWRLSKDDGRAGVSFLTSRERVAPQGTRAF